MTATVTSDRPANVTLVKGAMQRWSDLEHAPGGGASAAARTYVEQQLRPDARVALVGPHPLDLITGLAGQVAHLTVFTRSIPDAVLIGNALLECEGTEVVCGSVAHLPEAPEPFDLVIALDDMARVLSLETEVLDWQEVFDAVRALLADGGTLLLGVENELGLHRIGSLRSRYTSNDDATWSATATFDTGRPRTEAALTGVLADAGLVVRRLGIGLPAWEDQAVIATGTRSFSPQMDTLLAAATLGSAAFRRVGADPTRVTRAAVLSGRLPDLASGWFVVAGAGSGAADEDVATITATTPSGEVVTYTERDGAILTERDGVAVAEPVEVPTGSRLLSEHVLDACAVHDLPALRSLLRRYAGWLAGRPTRTSAGDRVGDIRMDAVLVADDGLVALDPGVLRGSAEDAAWEGLADLVRVIRARGARHPWPSATDDRTMMSIMGAMAELAPHPDLEALVGTESREPALPAYDVPGLLAVIERLTETNTALASRAQWFEDRLNTREREMRLRTARHDEELKRVVRQQELLRSSAEDVRRSITYRAGNLLIGPVRKVRDRGGR
ncbi:class I SAM-dependent methyltransferase [Luteipulveratus flavus]|uniref:Class I SAM-dependent methyltransferase n=1 Tax=Luteipulveratus flavus TaxID=3031728 RepID=A0ABT6C236_9MICO|nr:class I SAM-dependent methyltransferase [Luteipulveratus sp. YIM 133296]MDF8262966.1 class I SAM-dependent methyltransferase [Luteipulveratus sp. YIM 133296]